MKGYVKILLAGFLVLNLTSVAFLRKLNFTAAQNKIIREFPKLLGVNIQRDQSKLLGLQGLKLYEIETHGISVGELTDYSKQKFVLDYFYFNQERCLLRFSFNGRYVINNQRKMLCTAF